MTERAGQTLAIALPAVTPTDSSASRSSATCASSSAQRSHPSQTPVPFMSSVLRRRADSGSTADSLISTSATRRKGNHMNKLTVTAATVLALLLTGCGDLESSSDTTAADSGGSDPTTNPADGVSQGVGSKDASGDVTGVELVQAGDEFFSYTEVKVSVTNNSEKRSNYMIEVSVESPDGSTRHESTSVYVENLEPGQSTTETATLMENPPEGSVAKVKTVERLAST